ncbi:MAG: DUF4249 domain-containing protein [Leeuwenhoekiella sp.]
MILLLAFTACEEVIEVDLPETESRLVVDGLVRVPADSLNTKVTVRLTQAAGFFQDTVSTVENAKVSVQLDDEQFELMYQQNGCYGATIATEKLKEHFAVLNILNDGENYVAQAEFVPSAPVSAEQGTKTLFSGEETEVILTFTDIPNQENYYFFDMDFGEFITSDDGFYQGRQFSFSYFYEDLEPDTQIEINILGVDRVFFDYLNIILEQSGQNAGGPFSSPPVQLRGNIRNIDNPDNYALGYFAIAEIYSTTILIEDPLPN